MQFIDLKRQYESYKAEIDTALTTVLDHGRFIMGPEVGQLEERLAEYVGVDHCISTASGTDSLEIALRALGIGPGDEVIAVPFTWISTAEVIELVGAKPVFVDIEEESYNLNPALLAEAISPATKAIIPVSLFGQMPRLEEINRIAEKHSVVVIEDGAQSFGATRNGIRSCGMSVIGSTSFFPAKPFGCYGDGGALFTSSGEYAAKMRAIRSHGGEKRHHHTMVGMNGRFDTLQAAVLLAKLDRFPEEVERRHELGQKYSESLGGVCQVPMVSGGNTHVYGQYTIRVANRAFVLDRLREQGIPAAVYYPKCLHEQPVFSYLNYGHGDFPIAEIASEQVLSLPMHPFLSESEQMKVIEAVSAALANTEG